MSCFAYRRRAAIASLLMACAVVPGSTCALAASTPGPPLRILVGFTAGGTTDLAARVLAEHLGPLLGRTVVVDNRTGASGRIAASALKHAPPDGSTVMLAPMVVTTLAPMVWPRLDYDPVRDFAPVAHVAEFAIALAVNSEVPAHNIADFVAWVGASPARASYGVSASGSLPHLFGVIVGRATGIPWIVVPYRGRAPMESDLAGGRIPAAMDAVSNLIELHRAGRTRIIATSGIRRSSLLPDVATFREQGLPAVAGNGWIAMHAPAGAPQAFVDDLAAAVNEALRRPDVRQRLMALGFEPTGGTARELAVRSAEEVARWGPLIRAEGFRAE